MLEQLEDRTTPSSISGLSPAFGPTAGNGSVQIYGSGFTGATQVTFGGVSTFGVMVMSDTTISVQAPAHGAGVVDVQVTAPSGVSPITSADQYTYDAPPAPTVTHISPAAGPMAGGVEVEIDGSGFVSGSTTVSFGGTAASMFYFVNSGMLDAYSPAHASGVVDITVTTPNGTSSTSAADQFTYNPPIWTVVNTLDNGQGDLVTQTGDLRFCLNNAALAANGPGVTINFAIPGMGVQTITVSNPLPFITHALTINGYSQGGGSSSGPLVQLNGNRVPANGLEADAGGVTIQDLAIYDFAGNGVELNNPAGSAGDVVSGCIIGTDANGDAGVGNLTGVLVEGPNDTVGDAAGVATTIVSGNQNDGIDVSGMNAVGDLINDVWVGLGLTGLTPLANGGNGIALMAPAQGGTVAKNVIAGDRTGKNQIYLSGSRWLVKDNYIGIGKNGSTAVGGGGGGVLIINGSNNTVGGSAVDRNIIAGNAGDGVLVTGANAANNVVSGNYIGLDAFGNKQGNAGGVYLGGGAHDNTIGGARLGVGTGDGNAISGNNSDGVTISDPGTIDNAVLGNFIGTDSTGRTGKDNTGADRQRRQRRDNHERCIQQQGRRQHDSRCNQRHFGKQRLRGGD